MLDAFARVSIAVAALGGLVWLWLSMDMESLVMKVIAVGVLWAVWVVVVMGAVGIVAMFLGFVGLVAKKQ